MAAAAGARAQGRSDSALEPPTWDGAPPTKARQTVALRPGEAGVSASPVSVPPGRPQRASAAVAFAQAPSGRSGETNSRAMLWARVREFGTDVGARPRRAAPSRALAGAHGWVGSSARSSSLPNVRAPAVSSGHVHARARRSGGESAAPALWPGGRTPRPTRSSAPPRRLRWAPRARPHGRGRAGRAPCRAQRYIRDRRDSRSAQPSSTRPRASYAQSCEVQASHLSR
jgi:hypothetical protein